MGACRMLVYVTAAWCVVGALPAAVRIAVEMFNEGVMTKDEAITKVQERHLDQLLHPQFANEEEYADRVVGRGLPAKQDRDDRQHDDKRHPRQGLLDDRAGWRLDWRPNESAADEQWSELPLVAIGRRRAWLAGSVRPSLQKEARHFRPLA